MPQEPPPELPSAIGYICIDEPDEQVIAAWLNEIAACCSRERLRLICTVADRGYDGRDLARPGIVELQQALKDQPGLAVVLPTLEHLSPADSIRRALVLMIRHLGGRLVVVNKVTGDVAPESAEAESEAGDGGAS